MRYALALLLACLLPAQTQQAILISAQTAAAAGGNSDNFNGSNGTNLSTHNANWGAMNATCTVNSFVIQSNLLNLSGVFACGGALYTTSSSDISQVVVSAASTSAAINKSVCVRGANGGSSSRGYCVNFAAVTGANYTQIKITKNGTFFAVHTGLTYAFASDHTLRIVVSGTTTVSIQAYVDTTLISTDSDSSSPLGAGNPGISVGGDGTAADNNLGPWQDF
jgi:hypothetical protein